MDLDTSLSSRDAFLAHSEGRDDNAGTPLLVFCLRDLPQLSWQRGRAHAQAIERKATRIFARASIELLRDGDFLIHDVGSEWYGLALYARGRSGRRATAVDARSTLARLHLALERETQLTIDTGWTTLDESPNARTLIEFHEEALRKGARERERYAFFSLIGHELRTPLTSIRGYLETVLEDELDQVTSRRFIEIAYRETMRIGRLVDSLFDVSLLDLRNGAAERSRCSLRSAIAASIDATAAVRRQRDVQLDLTVTEDAPIGLHEDALTQIFVNIIDNAAKHGKHGGRIVVSIDARDERCVHAAVDDDGPGIAEHERSALFTLGERGRTSARGSGIGLGVVRLLIERAGGEVAIADSPLGGASFRLALPRFLDDSLAGNALSLL